MKNCFYKFYKNEQGFSLVEVAISLVIIGLLLGMGIPSVLHYLKWQKSLETKERQEKILYSLGGFVLTNGFLPLPANPYAIGEEFGVSRKEIKGQEDMKGILPFKTLGLPESYAKDGFNRYFTYVAGTSEERPHYSVSKIQKFCSSVPFYKIQVHRKSGLYTAEIDQTRDPIVVILLSHGENGFGAYVGTEGSVKQMREGSPHGADEVHNMRSSLVFIDRPLSKNKQDYFDDILVWSTRDNLMAIYGRHPCSTLPDNKPPEGNIYERIF